MTEKPAVVYTAVYDDEQAALAALDDLEALYDEEWIGEYDAAVMRKRSGEPHIVKRAAHPGVRVIGDLLGHGALPTNEVKQAVDELPAGKVGLIAVGDVGLERAFEDVVTRSVRTAQRDFTTTTDQLAGEMIQEFNAQAAQRRR